MRAGAPILGLVVSVTLACGEPASKSGPGGTGGAGTGGQSPSGGAPNPGAGRGGAGFGGSAAAAGGSVGAAAGAGGSGGSGAAAGSPGAGRGGSGGAPGVGGASAGMAGSGVGGGAGSSASGGAGTGGAGSGGMAGSPTGARYPFPQSLTSSRCTYPTSVSHDDVRAAYDKWKSEIVTSNGAGGHLRTQRPNSPGGEVNSTVSEGIAYGMMLAVALDDQHVFDELWKYSQLWLNGNGLMNWYINAAGTATNDTGGATDADEDMAWALVMAERQWGGQGTLDKPYLEYAKTQIKAIWDHEIDHQNGDFLLAGDEWDGNLIFNPSYFTPNEYRIFGEVTGDVAGWNRVIDTGYAILAKSLNTASGNASNGLAPAWCDVNGVPKVPFDNGPTNYQYDSARVPFRIGVDYCWSGDERAKTYLAKVSQFFAGIGASEIVDGYDLNGTPHPDPDTDGPQSAVFVGTAAVGAIHDAKFQGFVTDAYDLVATGELLARSRYYNLSWTALTLATLTGTFAEYPAR